MTFNNLEIDWEYLLERIDRYLDLGEEYLTRKLIDYEPEPHIFAQQLAFRWIKSYHTGYFEHVASPDLQDHANLIDMDNALAPLCENIAQFVHDLPCNNVLLRGHPGSGKRSAIKGLLKKFGHNGLRLIQIHREDLHQLPLIISCLRNLPFYFILLCVDIFHSISIKDHRELINLIQGDIEERATNVLLCATSNHASSPSSYASNSDCQDFTIRGKRSEEKPLAEPDFGIIINLDPMQKETYLAICQQALQQYGLPSSEEPWQTAALSWANQHGGYTGLAARQFTDDLAGKIMLRQRLTNSAK